MLSAKTKLLDPSQLDQIEGRVQALGSRLNQLTEKKEAVVEADKDSKVRQTPLRPTRVLYELKCVGKTLKVREVVSRCGEVTKQCFLCRSVSCMTW